jgi:gliding motility-associated-like protein
MSFENGDLTNWKCFWGTVAPGTGGGKSVPVWTSYTEHIDHHRLVRDWPDGNDPYGGFPVQCPGGAIYSLKLGKDKCGAQAEGVSYTYDIPATMTNFSLTFKYAVVLQDIHQPEERPRFRALVYDLTNNELIPCMDFDFTETLADFASVPNSTIRYKSWSPVHLDLGSYAGRTIRIEFFTTDCTDQTDCAVGPPPGHWCYAYVDFNIFCNTLPDEAPKVCQAPEQAILTAPDGYIAYTWYADMSFSASISSTQQCVISPPPAPGTSFPVIVLPKPGLGCMDTLSVIMPPVEVTPKPYANTGPDVIKCVYDRIHLGPPPPADLSLRYKWEPRGFLENYTSPTPFVITGVRDTIFFTLVVTDPTTGCTDTGHVTVTPILVDTTLNVTGPLLFCEGMDIDTKFMVTGTLDSVRWVRNRLLIPGANNPVYEPSSDVTGTYRAVIYHDGCRDSTRNITIKTDTKPEAKFSLGGDYACIYMPAVFKNESTGPPGQTLSYLWRFNDGTTLTTLHARKVFTTLNPVDVTLIARTEKGCADSVTQTFNVANNCGVYVPTAFSPNGDGLNDVFIPILSGDQVLRRFQVYDRTGAIVYSSSTKGEGWDGKINSYYASSGVYIWVLEYDSDAEKGILAKGTVSLIR